MRRFTICAMLSGCSFATVRGPQRVRAPETPLRCTTTAIAPIVDVVTGMIAAGGFAVATREPVPEDEVGQATRRVQQATMATTSVVTLASAAFGFAKIDRCLRARQDPRP